MAAGTKHIAFLGEYPGSFARPVLASLPNAPGLIDSGYRGEVRVLLLNTDRRERFAIEPGDRIAQLVLVRVEGAELEDAEELDETARGAGGFGSTGR